MSYTVSIINLIKSYDISKKYRISSNIWENSTEINFCTVVAGCDKLEYYATIHVAENGITCTVKHPYLKASFKFSVEFYTKNVEEEDVDPDDIPTTSPMMAVISALAEAIIVIA